MRLLTALTVAVAVLVQPATAAARPLASPEHAKETRWLAAKVRPHTHDRGQQEASSRPTVWDALAACESHGEWDYNEHSGWGSGLYDGGLQFDPGTWLAFGGGEYAPTADRATREQQIAIAERVLDAQGWVAWPACSRALGLR